MTTVRRRARCKRNSAHRLNLVVYQSQHLNFKQVTEIANYLQVPPRALHHSLLKYGDDHGNFEPISFSVMTHMKLPAHADRRYTLGVAILPTLLLKPPHHQRIHESYELRLKAACAAATTKQTLSGIRQAPIEVAYHMLKRVKEVTDATQDTSEVTHVPFHLKITNGLCLATYEAVRPA